MKTVVIGDVHGRSLWKLIVNQENPDRDLKIAGDTGIVCRIDDQPIYRQTFYTSNMLGFDQLITHDNTDEIKDVMYAQKTMNTL